jgi:hypothetical protein
LNIERLVFNIQGIKYTLGGGVERQRPHPAGSYGVAKDKFNAVTFKPVTTTGLRLEVQLQPKVSGGILEWRMK